MNCSEPKTKKLCYDTTLRFIDLSGQNYDWFTKDQRLAYE